jgi:N-methylhydantoinase B
MTLYQGDVFRHELPGGGGWGDPLKRDPQKVLKDVRNEFVSLECAVTDYGVVIDDATWQVDEAATTLLREVHREKRGVEPLPTVTWKDA